MSEGRFLNQTEAVKQYFPELTRGGLRVLSALGILPGRKRGNWFVYEEQDLIDLRKRLDPGLEELRNQATQVA